VKIGIIVQARLNSSRFPNKVLEKIYKNYSIIDFLLKRINKTRLVDSYILAVPLKDKKIFSSIAKKHNFLLFCGSEKNVLKRFYDTATKYKLDTIIRVTSDSPLMSSSILEKSIKIFKRMKIDYLNNIIEPSYPLGVHIEILNYKSLKIAYEKTKNVKFLEHVTPYIYNNKNKFKIYTQILKNRLNEYRFTIDFEKDLKMLKNAILTSKKGLKVTYRDIVLILKKNPNLVKINHKIEKRFYIHNKK
jgi:spore coat polysaccharide biosynthesis protein SpsF (cytidylyltransferase family)